MKAIWVQNRLKGFTYNWPCLFRSRGYPISGRSPGSVTVLGVYCFWACLCPLPSSTLSFRGIEFGRASSMKLVEVLKAFQILETSGLIFFFFCVYLSPHRLAHHMLHHPPNPISSVISPSEVFKFDKLHERSTFHRYDRIVITYQPSLLSLLIPTLMRITQFFMCCATCYWSRVMIKPSKNQPRYKKTCGIDGRRPLGVCYLAPLRPS